MWQLGQQQRMFFPSLCGSTAVRFRIPPTIRQVLPNASVAVLAVLLTCDVGQTEDRTFDGSGNNLANPLWGSAGTDYSREASGAHYADGISAPQVVGLPSARAVSNSLMTQGEDSVLDPRGL